MHLRAGRALLEYPLTAVLDGITMSARIGQAIQLVSKMPRSAKISPHEDGPSRVTSVIELCNDSGAVDATWSLSVRVGRGVSERDPDQCSTWEWTSQLLSLDCSKHKSYSGEGSGHP